MNHSFLTDEELEKILHVFRQSELDPQRKLLMDELKGFLQSPILLPFLKS